MTIAKSLTPRFWTITTIAASAAVFGAFFRLIPHPPNFTPIGAMALFSGACFADRRLGFLIPFTAMFLSDLVIGLYPMLPVTYACFGCIVVLGWWLRQRRTVVPVAMASLIASTFFFIVTNFAAWASYPFYAKTWDGLIACYTAAIPFFGNTVGGDLLFCLVLFGGLWLLETAFPSLRTAQTPLQTHPDEQFEPIGTDPIPAGVDHS